MKLSNIFLCASALFLSGTLALPSTAPVTDIALAERNITDSEIADLDYADFEDEDFDDDDFEEGGGLSKRDNRCDKLASSTRCHISIRRAMSIMSAGFITRVRVWNNKCQAISPEVGIWPSDKWTDIGVPTRSYKKMVFGNTKGGFTLSGEVKVNGKTVIFNKNNQICDNNCSALSRCCKFKFTCPK